MAKEQESVTSETRWQDPRRGPWGIRAMWAELDGRLECVGLTLMRGAEPSFSSVTRYAPIRGQRVRPVTATAVAELPIGTIIDRLREIRMGTEDATRTSLAELRDELAAEGYPSADVDELLATSDRARRGEGQGRRVPPRYDRDHFVRVAEVYLVAWQEGRAPTQAVADTFGVSRSAAAKWITRARGDLQLLTPATHGRAGAEPGPALKRRPTRSAKR